MQNKLCTFGLLFFLPIIICAQTSKTVDFYKNYEHALASAKKQNKLLAVWIGKKNLQLTGNEKDKNVANFYNQHFVNFYAEAPVPEFKIYLPRQPHAKVSPYGFYFVEPQDESIRHLYTNYENLTSENLLRQARWALDTNMAYKYAVEKFLREVDANNFTVKDKPFLLHVMQTLPYYDQIFIRCADIFRSLPADYKNLSFEDACFIYDFIFTGIFKTGNDFETVLENNYISFSDPEYAGLLNYTKNFYQYFDSVEIAKRIAFLTSMKSVAGLFSPAFDENVIAKYAPYLNQGIFCKGKTCFSEGVEYDFSDHCLTNSFNDRKIVLLQCVPEDTLDKTDCLKAFLFLKKGDTLQYNAYSQKYIEYAWNNATAIEKWIEGVWYLPYFNKFLYEKSLKRVEALEPKNANTTRLLAEFYFQQENYSRALDYIEKTISLTPKDDNLSIFDGNFISDNNYAFREKIIQKLK